MDKTIVWYFISRKNLKIDVYVNVLDTFSFYLIYL